MTSIKRVLLPTDLSPQSRKLATCDADLKRMGAEEVTVLYSLKAGLVLKDAGIALLEEMIGNLRDSGFKADFEIVAGDNAVLDILAFAKEKECDMIMMASSGKGMAKEFLVGSTSKGVMRRSDITVFLKRYHVSAESVTESCEQVLNRVLAVIDSQADESSYKESMEGIFKGGLLPIHLLDVSTGTMGAWDKGISLTEAISKMEVGTGSKISVMKALDSISGTLIVLPRKGKGSVGRFLRGGGSKRSIHNSEVSILVIPE